MQRLKDSLTGINSFHTSSVRRPMHLFIALAFWRPLQGGTIPKAGMLKARRSKRKVDTQKTEAGVPEIICTLLLLLSRSRTKNSAKLAERSAEAMMVNRTSSRSPTMNPA